MNSIFIIFSIFVPLPKFALVCFTLISDNKSKSENSRATFLNYTFNRFLKFAFSIFNFTMIIIYKKIKLHFVSE